MTVPAPTTAPEQPAVLSSVDVELLALDLGSCTRCTRSSANVATAIALTAPLFDALGIAVHVDERVIGTEEQASRHRMLASPTIRIGGADIAPDLRETHCEPCSGPCGCGEGTNCRVWPYRGELHEQAPVGMIAEALVHAVFRGSAGESPDERPAEPFEGVPANLTRFFADMAADSRATSCCGPDERETCCELEEKSSCCGDGESDTCGCR